MFRLSLSSFALFLAVSAPCVAQVGVSTPMPYGGVRTHVSGVWVTPVPNSPMSAVVDISDMRILPDGTTVLRKTLEKIARDSSGRIYNEMRAMVPVTYQHDPALLSAHIFDPRTRISIMFSPSTHVAHQLVLPPVSNDRQIAPDGVPPPPLHAKTVDLGESTVSGIRVHGTRYLIPVDAKVSGTGKPMQITQEYFYSPDLRLNMMVVHDDPRTGQQIVTITRVKLREPDSRLFDAPAGFRVVNENSEAGESSYRPPSLQ